MNKITYSANSGAVLRNFAAGTLSALSLWLGAGTSALGQLPPPTVPQPPLTIDPSRFQLERHGPANLDPLAQDHYGGFPQWYQDKTGLALELGTVEIPEEIANAWLIVGPVGLGPAGEFYQFPVAGTFLDEHFYFHAAATGTFPIPAGVDLKQGALTTDILVELGHEAAFGSGLTEEWGSQWVFTRQRIVVRTAPYDGSYLLETPYKNFRLDDQIAGQRIFFTEDFGAAQMPAGYDNSLQGTFGPYLVPADAPGGTELPPFAPATAGGRKYLADPGVQNFVTGSPIGQNYVRLSHWNGTAWQELFYTNKFSLTGRLKQGTVASQVTLDEAVRYEHPDPAQRRVDVFAMGQLSLPTRLPGSGYANRVAPEVDLFLGAPADIATLTPIRMAVNPGPGVCYYAQALGGDPAFPLNAPFPTTVTVRDAYGFIVSKDVTDALFIASANYLSASKTLQVSVSSASGAEPASYELFGVDGLVAPNSVFQVGQITVPNLAAPPTHVTVKSSGGGRATANVVVLAGDAANAPQNQAPVAVADEFLTEATEGAPAVLPVLANDTDGNNDVLAVTAVTQPEGGTVTISAGGGTVTFTASKGSPAVQHFNYTVSDLKGGSAQGSVTVHVNANPVAPTVQVVATVGTLGSVDALASVTDREQVAFEYTALGPVLATSGAVVPPTQFQTGMTAANGVITVLAAPSAPAQVSFTYTVSDLHGGTATGTVVVTVNHHPTAANDSIIGYANQPIRFNVLSNDTDPDGDVLLLDNVEQPAGAQVAFTADGQVSFLTDTAGSYGFNYTVRDGRGGVANARVALDVQLANQNPVALDDVATVTPNIPALLNVLANDTDAQPLAISGITQPAQGGVVISQDLKQITYTPNAAAIGTVQAFTYTVTDGFGGSATANVTLNVRPLAVADSVSVVAGSAVAINVLSNDLGPNLVISSVTAPLQGQVSIAPDGRSLNFTGDAGAAGVTQNITYTIASAGGTASAAVAVRVVDRVTFGATATYSARQGAWNLSGTASPGARVQLTVGTTLVTTVTANATTGAWTFTGRVPLPAANTGTTITATSSRGGSASRTFTRTP